MSMLNSYSKQGSPDRMIKPKAPKIVDESEAVNSPEEEESESSAVYDMFCQLPPEEQDKLMEQCAEHIASREQPTEDTGAPKPIDEKKDFSMDDMG